MAIHLDAAASAYFRERRTAARRALGLAFLAWLASWGIVAAIVALILQIL